MAPRGNSKAELLVGRIDMVTGKFFQKLRFFDVDINGGIERAEV